MFQMLGLWWGCEKQDGRRGDGTPRLWEENFHHGPIILDPKVTQTTDLSKAPARSTTRSARVKIQTAVSLVMFGITINIVRGQTLLFQF